VVFFIGWHLPDRAVRPVLFYLIKLVKPSTKVGGFFLLVGTCPIGLSDQLIKFKKLGLSTFVKIATTVQAIRL
jgi:hypothetical protein